MFILVLFLLNTSHDLLNLFIGCILVSGIFCILAALSNFLMTVCRNAVDLVLILYLANSNLLSVLMLCV